MTDMLKNATWWTLGVPGTVQRISSTNLPLMLRRNMFCVMLFLRWGAARLFTGCGFGFAFAGFLFSARFWFWLARTFPGWGELTSRRRFVVGRIKSLTFKNDTNWQVNFPQALLIALRAAGQWFVIEALVNIKLHTTRFTTICINWHGSPPSVNEQFLIIFLFAVNRKCSSDDLTKR